MRAPTLASVPAPYRLLRWELPNAHWADRAVETFRELGIEPAGTGSTLEILYTEPEMNHVMFACYLIHESYKQREALNRRL